MSPSIKLPKYVKPEKDRNGNIKYIYFRRGSTRLRMQESLFSKEWWSHYERLLEDKPAAYQVPGSLKALVTAYRSSTKWKGLKPTTQKSYQLAIDRLLLLWGTQQLGDIQPKHIVQLQDKLEDEISARKSDETTAVLSALLTWGQRRGHCNSNPAKGFERRYKANNYKPWPRAVLQRFFNQRPKSGEENELRSVLLVCAAALYTAQRQDDLLSMTESQYDRRAGLIYVKPRKTERSSGVDGFVPVHAALRELLEARPERHMMLLVDHRGKPWTTDSFSHSFRKFRDRLGMKGDYVFHGLRSTLATILREHGVATNGIRSITLHSNDRMAEQYSKGADQLALAQEAMKTIEDERLW